MFTPIKAAMQEFIAHAYPEGEPVLKTGNPLSEEGLCGGLYSGEILLAAIPAPLRQLVLADLMHKADQPCAAIWLGSTDWRHALSNVLQQKLPSDIDVLHDKCFARTSTSDLLSLLQTQAQPFGLIFIDGLNDTPETGLVVAALRQCLPGVAFVLGIQPGPRARQLGLPCEHFDCAATDKSLSIPLMSDSDRPYVEASSWRTGRQSGAYIQLQPHLAWEI